VFHHLLIGLVHHLRVHVCTTLYVLKTETQCRSHFVCSLQFATGVMSSLCRITLLELSPTTLWISELYRWGKSLKEKLNSFPCLYVLSLFLRKMFLQVFQTLHTTGQSSMVRDWVMLSLSNFTQRTPVAMAMWSLSCFFVSASTSQWISAMYPKQTECVSLLGKCDSINDIGSLGGQK